VICQCYKTRLRSREKHFADLSGPSACPHSSARLQLNGLPWNFILGNFMKIRRESTNFVKIGQKCLALYMKIWVRFIAAGAINSTLKHLCTALHIIMLLAVTCSSGMCVQHSIFLCYWPWRVSQECTENAFIPFRCNNGYANAPHYSVIRAVPVSCGIFFDM